MSKKQVDADLYFPTCIRDGMIPAAVLTVVLQVVSGRLHLLIAAAQAGQLSALGLLPWLAGLAVQFCVLSVVCAVPIWLARKGRRRTPQS